GIVKDRGLLDPGVAVESKRDDRAPLMSSLLPIHAASTLEWLVDATSTAAEGALSAPYTFFYVEDQQGRLERKSPASDLRRRSQQRSIDAFGQELLPKRIDPKDAPAIATALDASVAELSS